MNWEEAVASLRVKVMKQMSKVMDRELSLTLAAAEIGLMPSELLACYRVICREQDGSPSLR